jgi:hypothetical protein
MTPLLKKVAKAKAKASATATAKATATATATATANAGILHCVQNDGIGGGGVTVSWGRNDGFVEGGVPALQGWGGYLRSRE